MSPRDALKMAQALDLDLVKVAPQAKPPVCKILDYGKYRFEMQKKEKEAKKNQKVIELKEIRLSLRKVLAAGPQGKGFHPVPRPRNGAHQSGY